MPTTFVTTTSNPTNVFSHYGSEVPSVFDTTTSNPTNVFLTSTGVGANVFNVQFPLTTPSVFDTTTTWIGIWNELSSMHTFSNLTTNWEAI